MLMCVQVRRVRVSVCAKSYINYYLDIIFITAR